MGYLRYHIDLGGKRTTVSLDETISCLLLFKLGSSPESEDAHQVVREWLQKLVDERKYKGRYRLSELSSSLREHAITYLVDKKLSQRYWDWCLQ